jgi:hypothetical protein
MEQWSDPDPGSGIKHPGSATLLGSKIILIYSPEFPAHFLTMAGVMLDSRHLSNRLK